MKRLSCTLLVASLAVLLTHVDAQQGAPAATLAEQEATLLMSLPRACSNWRTATDGLRGTAWQLGTPPCGTPGVANSSWHGLLCNAAGSVFGACLPATGLICTYLPAELAQLQALQTLDLANNYVAGTVPREWTAVGAFPSLQTLELGGNSLTGSLDDFTMVATGMIAGLFFNVSRNSFDQGTVPAGWYSKTLAVIDISYNGVSGELPVQWGLPVPNHPEYTSAFPKLSRLVLEGNNISGTADPWPGGGAVVFASDFYCTGRPGNPLMTRPANIPKLGGSGGLSTGAIAGIAVGAVAAAGLVAALAGFLLMRSRRRRAVAASAPRHPAGANSNAALAGSRCTLGESPKGSDNDPEKGNGSNHGWLDSAGEGQYNKGEGSYRNSAVTDSAAMTMTTLSLASGSGGGSLLKSEGSDGRDTIDTDARRLPSEWNTVGYHELEMSHTIGSGSFGSVWLAKYCQTTVAVKVLGGDKAPSTSDSTYQRHVIRELEKEASIMSKLRHTNVCLYMGACVEPPCLIMEYCARKSVDTLLTQGRKDPRAAKQLTWPRMLSMACDAAKGMLYLHTRQPAVYHRDLKSANLLVTSQWQVKVADFNLSRALENDHMSTLCIQNPRWLAPEVLAGSSGGLPADVWAFGTVLWELMTWQAPYGGCNPYQIINAVQAASSGSGLVVPPADALPGGPFSQFAEYVALMDDCWQRDPEERPAFEEVVERLRAMLSSEVKRPNCSLLTTPLGSTYGSMMRPSGLSTPQRSLPTSASGVLPPGAWPHAPASEPPSAQGSGTLGASLFAAAPPAAPSPQGSGALAASPFGAAAPSPQGSGALPASPFGAAAAAVAAASPSPAVPRRLPPRHAPRATATRQASATLSPFATAAADTEVARLQQAAADEDAAAAAAATPISPFAAVAATRADTAPDTPAELEEDVDSKDGGGAAAHFDNKMSSVLASFTRMGPPPAGSGSLDS